VLPQCLCLEVYVAHGADAPFQPSTSCSITRHTCAQLLTRPTASPPTPTQRARARWHRLQTGPKRTSLAFRVHRPARRRGSGRRLRARARGRLHGRAVRRKGAWRHGRRDDHAPGRGVNLDCVRLQHGADAGLRWQDLPGGRDLDQRRIKLDVVRHPGPAGRADANELRPARAARKPRSPAGQLCRRCSESLGSRPCQGAARSALRPGRARYAVGRARTARTSAAAAGQVRGGDAPHGDERRADRSARRADRHGRGRHVNQAGRNNGACRPARARE